MDDKTTMLVAAVGAGALVMYMIAKDSNRMQQLHSDSADVNAQTNAERFTEVSRTRNNSLGAAVYHNSGQANYADTLSAGPELQTLDRRIPGISLYPIADHIGAIQLASAGGGYNKRIPLTSRTLDALGAF